MHVPIASTVAVSLKNDVVIRSGRTTVIAFVKQHQRLPSGTRLVGKASASSDGVVTIRFSAIAFPDGRSAKAQAEALDRSTGSPDLLGSLTGGVVPSREPGLASSVGSSTVDRVASEVLGGSIAGGIARQTLSESRRSTRRRSHGAPRVVTLPKETQLEVLFLREVRVTD